MVSVPLGYIVPRFDINPEIIFRDDLRSRYVTEYSASSSSAYTVNNGAGTVKIVLGFEAVNQSRGTRCTVIGLYHPSDTTNRSALNQGGIIVPAYRNLCYDALDKLPLLMIDDCRLQIAMNDFVSGDTVRYYVNYIEMTRGEFDAIVQ
jgi:hypothetical protein